MTAATAAGGQTGSGSMVSGGTTGGGAVSGGQTGSGSMVGGTTGGGAVSSGQTGAGATSGAAGGGATTGGGQMTGATGGATSGATATPARPAVREFSEIAALQDIYFDFDQSTIKPEAARTLDANASWMKSNANHLILIEGHCDERGTNEYNLALGERRARSTMNYLVAQGVQANRITIISYGEERPVCTEKTEACWAKNRRAHFLVKAR